MEKKNKELYLIRTPGKPDERKKVEPVKEKYFDITLSEGDINYILIALSEAIKQELQPGEEENSIFGNREIALELIKLHHDIATFIVG